MNDKELLGMIFGMLVFASATQVIITTLIQEARQEANFYQPDLQQF